MSQPESKLLELKLPPLAESVVEGEVMLWLIEVGQSVTEGQSVLEVMTDKVTVELPSPFSGTLREQKVKVGEVVPVGAVLALVEARAAPSTPEAPSAPEAPLTPKEERQPPVALPVAGHPTPPAAQAQEAAGNLQEERSIIESGAAIATDTRSVADVFSRVTQHLTPASPVRASVAPAAAPGRVLAVPSARKLARQKGLDLADITGSGPNGVVRYNDVEAHITSPAPAAASVSATAAHERRIPFKGQRRAISQGLMASLASTALTHTIEELDTTELTTLRDQLRPEAQERGLKLSYMPFFLKAVGLALSATEALNSSLDESTQEIVYHNSVHLGIAINTEKGLIVPVVRDVHSKSLLELSRQVTDLTARALGGKLLPEELRGATFTVSNIGALGALVGFPIVTPPSVGILSLHGIIRRPIALMQGDEETVAIRPMMYLTLGFDHRLVDGVDAVLFTKHVTKLLEQPRLMTLYL